MPAGYYTNMAQTSGPVIDAPPKAPNVEPYLNYSSDPKLPPLESRFRSYDGQWVNPKDVNVYPALSQQKGEPEDNKPPYLKYSSDPKQPPLESRFRSYDGQWVNPKDVNVYPALV